MGDSSAFDKHYVQAERENAWAKIQQAEFAYKAQVESSKNQADALIATTNTNNDTKIKQIASEEKVQLRALDVRELEAKSEERSRMREADVQAIKNEGLAKAAVMTAEAQGKRADAQQIRAKGTYVLRAARSQQYPHVYSGEEPFPVPDIVV